MIENLSNDTTPDGILASLAEQIKETHRKYLSSLKASLEHARSAGTLLIGAREEVGKGRWMVWVQENCGFTISTAQRYIKVADNYHKLIQLGEFELIGLSLTAALRIVSDKPAGGEGCKPAVCEPIRVAPASATTLARRVTEVQFGDDSREEKFVRERAAVLARQVVSVARKSKVADDKGQPIGPADVAVALLMRLKDALKEELVVVAEIPTPPNEHEGPVAQKEGTQHEVMAAA